MNIISKQDYNQKISILNKTIREEKERLMEVFRKRNTFKRIYTEILDALKLKNFESAAQGYFDIANKQLERRDYDTTSVLVFLGSLCILNLGSELTKLQDYFEGRFLQSTFSIKLLKLLLQAKTDGLQSEYLTLWSMMKAIPLFEEEKILIENIIPI